MSFESENKNVEKIVVSNKTYYLVGTSHISENSVKLVKEVIERVQPDTVSIELDKKRYEKYTNSNQWGNTDIIKIIKEKKLVVLISNIVYSAYQKKLANTKGTTQAGELIQAVKSAKEIGANIQLIDRDIQVTFKRMWRHLSFLEKPKLFMTFFTEFDDIEQDKLEEYLESDSFDKVFISFGPFTIYWYSCFIVVGIIIGYFVSNRRAKRAALPEDTIVDLLLYGLPVSIISARLYYVLFELPLYIDDPLSIFKIWEGGLAIHGGLIGAVLTGVIYCKKKHLSFWNVADVVAPSIVIGQIIGRWGNFLFMTQKIMQLVNIPMTKKTKK